MLRNRWFWLIATLVIGVTLVLFARWWRQTYEAPPTGWGSSRSVGGININEVTNSEGEKELVVSQDLEFFVSHPQRCLIEDVMVTSEVPSLDNPLFVSSTINESTTLQWHRRYGFPEDEAMKLLIPVLRRTTGLRNPGRVIGNSSSTDH